MTKPGGEGALITRVMNDIRDRIERRALNHGNRLPSIRAQAAALEVSKSTVVEAYERLVAEGLIEARRGSGFFVSDRLPPFNIADAGPRIEREIDPVWVTRQSLDTGSDTLKPGCGWLPESWMPDEAIRRGLRTLARKPLAPLTSYGTPQGLPALRQLLARRIRERGINASPAQLMLTESSTQAIDLLCRFLLEPGATVLVDDPCYFSLQAMLRAHRVNIVSVPYTPNGPDLHAFEQCLLHDRPRLYITNAAPHNPTGATLTFDTAHRVLRLAEQHGLTIIEDDVFADFETTPSPRLAALDGLQQVIHIGSFSKTLSASVRVGYIAARADWLEGLVDLKLATAFESGHFSAELLLTLLGNGTYRKHMEAVRRRLAEATSQTLANVRQLGMTPWLEPSGGMFLWVALPEGLDAATIAQQAIKQQVLLAPGNVFSLSQRASHFMRFNVAQSLEPRIYEVLGEIIQQQQRPTALFSTEAGQEQSDAGI